MKHFILIALLLCLVSCGEKKLVQLPEISNSEITEIEDVSHAYLFYNETMPDSVELNRKNLISTTNWLINVDKRLTLKQVIPHIKFLQDKKNNSSHKNENAKNYFTCHDMSRNNLGFVEFSDVIYNKLNSEKLDTKKKTDSILIDVSISFDSENLVIIDHFDGSDSVMQTMDWNKFIDTYKKFDLFNESIDLYFNKNLSFQDYITIRSFLNNIDVEDLLISKTEYIY